MKSFFNQQRKKAAQRGFSLVEALFSVSLLSASILTLAPLLALGLKTARVAHADEATAQIAQTLAEEARQGTLPTGNFDVDDSGATCLPARASFSVQTTGDSPSADVSRVTLRVTPVGAPDRMRIYAVMFPSQD